MQIYTYNMYTHMYVCISKVIDECCEEIKQKDIILDEVTKAYMVIIGSPYINIIGFYMVVGHHLIKLPVLAMYNAHPHFWPKLSGKNLSF